MRKKQIAVLFILTILSACWKEEAIPDQAGLKAVYAVLNEKTFVITEIFDDHGNNLLDHLYPCAKDDTFSIKRSTYEEVESYGILSVRVDLGNDWCNRPDAEERLNGWEVSQGSGAYHFEFLLPPKYNKMIFISRPESKYLYTPDDKGNFTLSIADDSNYRTYYVFTNIK